MILAWLCFFFVWLWHDYGIILAWFWHDIWMFLQCFAMFVQCSLHAPRMWILMVVHLFRESVCFEKIKISLGQFAQNQGWAPPENIKLTNEHKTKHQTHNRSIRTFSSKKNTTKMSLYMPSGSADQLFPPQNGGEHDVLKIITNTNKYISYTVHIYIYIFIEPNVKYVFLIFHVCVVVCIFILTLLCIC